MDNLRVRLTGIAPLLMHNSQLANPFNPFAKAMKLITSKPAKKKTEADGLELYWLEWQGGLYWDAETGPYIPAANLESLVNDGGRMQRKGQDVNRGFWVLEPKNPLVCAWPKKKDLKTVFDDGSFTDLRMIVNPSTGGRSMRCRPIFTEWAVEFSADFDPEILNRDDCIRFIAEAGKKVGLCDGRPRFGRYESEVVK